MTGGTYFVSGVASGGVVGDSFTHTFPGTCRAVYSVDAAGVMTLERISMSLDRELHLRSSGLFTGTHAFTFSKGIVHNVNSPSVPLTRVGTSGELADFSFPIGAVAASASMEVNHNGTVTREGYTSITNSTPFVGRLDPFGRTFRMSGTFQRGSNRINVACVGGYDNRPPVSRIGISPFLEQISGCPAQLDAKKKWVVEANAPGSVPGQVAYKGYVRWLSTDPDSAGVGGGIVDQIGTLNGALFSPPSGLAAFVSGVSYAFTLVDVDTYGSRSSDQCAFEVVDTRPPVVTPPASATLECSQRGGALGSALPTAFLTGARATDAASTPSLLPPQIAGAPLSGTTFLPVGTNVVTFSARDGVNNVGSATATVTVRDSLPPSGYVKSSLSSTTALKGASVAVRFTPIASDANDCSAVTATLYKITSNEPSLDATDVMDASFGTEDLDIVFARRLTLAGATRNFTVTYRLADATGNASYASKVVSITP